MFPEAICTTVGLVTLSALVIRKRLLANDRSSDHSHSESTADFLSCTTSATVRKSSQVHKGSLLGPKVRLRLATRQNGSTERQQMGPIGASYSRLRSMCLRLAQECCIENLRMFPRVIRRLSASGRSFYKELASQQAQGKCRLGSFSPV